VTIYNESFMVVECDAPGCKTRKRFREHFSDEDVDQFKNMENEGWSFIDGEIVDTEHVSFTGSTMRDYEICLCPEHAKCDFTEMPPKKHEHIFIRMTVKGIPSRGGSVLTCFFCGGNS
jgi:hypothetical protein